MLSVLALAKAMMASIGGRGCPVVEWGDAATPESMELGAVEPIQGAIMPSQANLKGQ